MLEFIVTGRIPGSSIELTFNWLLLIAAVVLIYIDFLLVKSRHLNLQSAPTKRNQSKAKKLCPNQKLQAKSLQAKYFRRTAEALLSNNAARQ